jgi:hypothetical protein
VGCRIETFCLLVACDRDADRAATIFRMIQAEMVEKAPVTATP